MSAVILTGFGSNDPVPGNYVEVKFAEGPGSLGEGTYPVLFLGNMLSTGSATPDTVVYGPLSSPALSTEGDAITLFGAGSELHRQIREFLKVNTVTPFYAVAVTESAGTAATISQVISNTATGDGTYRFYCGDEFIDTPISNGQAPGSLATAVVANIKSQTHWPVTAAVASTVNVVVTAKQKGLRGNWLRVGAQIFGTVSTAATNTAQQFLSAGTPGATADSNTAALATISDTRYYYICSAAEDATQFGALVTQVGTMSLPTNGMRQRAITASVDSLGNATTVATGINNPRAEIGWLAQGDQEPPVLAAKLVGVYTLEELPFPFRTNFSGYGNDTATSLIWKMAAPRSGAAPTRPNIMAAILGGLTPIGVTRQRTTYIVRRVTTKTSTSSVADYRIRDAHKVTICDRYADELVNKLTLNYSGKKIANDPPSGARVPGADVVTPRVMKAAVDQLTRDFANVDLLEDPEGIIRNTLVQRETSPNTRMGIRVGLKPISNLEQTASELDQIA